MNAIAEEDKGATPRTATEAEQHAVYRRRTRLPTGLTEDELFAGYSRPIAQERVA